MIPKYHPFVSKKLRDYAKDYECQNPLCSKRAHADTVVMAHYHGHWAHFLGKGYGIKCTDLAGSYLCNYCHMVFDEQIKVSKDELMLMKRIFWIAVARTHNQLANDGRLVIV